MAVINYSARVNYYSFLQGAPTAWELLFPILSGINRGDTVNVIEVDSSGSPTGNSMTGTVVYVRSNDFWDYRSKSTLVFVIPD